jgi:hypothetical protein
MDSRPDRRLFADDEFSAVTESHRPPFLQPKDLS